MGERKKGICRSLIVKNPIDLDNFVLRYQFLLLIKELVELFVSGDEKLLIKAAKNPLIYSCSRELQSKL